MPFLAQTAGIGGLFQSTGLTPLAYTFLSLFMKPTWTDVNIGDYI